MSQGRAKPHGHLIDTRDDGREIWADTCQCPHCGGHWKWTPGSGRKHKWCWNCGEMTCGREACEECVPWEQRMENLESGKPRLWVPTRVGWERQK